MFCVSCCAVVISSVWVYGAPPSLPDAPLADQKLAEGWEAYRRGDLESAVNRWKESDARYRRAGQVTGRIEALRNQGMGLRALGRYAVAVMQLRQATQLAEDAGDLARRAALYDDLGVVLTLTRDLDSARAALEKGLALASAHHDQRAEASVLNNLGNLQCARGQYDQAMQFYLRCISVCRPEGDQILLATATTNGAMAAVRTKDHSGGAIELAQQAQETVRRLEPTSEQAFLLITVGRMQEALMRRFPARRQQGLRSAFQAYQLGLTVAEALGNRRAKTYALEGLAGLYEAQGRNDEALRLAQRAARLAGRSNLANALYRLQWQIGRLHASWGERTKAIEAYRQAVGTFGSIRHEVAIGYGNRFFSPSSKQEAGGLLSELADLLLQQAEVTADQRQAQRLMREAIQNFERLKTAELVDYFRDQCLQDLQTRNVKIEEVSADTAVVYFVSLPDRTEILVAIGGHLTRFEVGVDREQLVEEVKRFRYELEDLSTLRHLRHAQQLHQWLIAPIDAHLSAKRVDTLVFVPDSPLRLIPMAALHDGRQYLVQQYAVAITPGLTLTDPKSFQRGRIRLLAGGLTQPLQEGYSHLPQVKEEIDQVASIFGSTKLVDEEFVLEKFQQQLRQNPYSIVHIASHARFGADPDDTFVLAYDTKVTLSDLEGMIRPAQFRDHPIELLTLSACQTAAGNDHTALGLAGIAVKAGARSALATLWSVQDRASAILMTEFYTQIRDHPEISKAKALQRSQLKLLDDPLHRDPNFWSPFLIIGNWK